MSIGTILGLIVALALFLGSISLATDNFLVFLNFPSFILVVGGAAAV